MESALAKGDAKGGKKRSSADNKQQARVPLVDGETNAPPTTCRYCIVLSKSAFTSTAIYSTIKALPFAISHKPFKSKWGDNGWRLGPDNCLQWLHTSRRDRAKALESSTSKQLCHICLGIPNAWNAAQTSCEGPHSTRRRDNDTKVSVLCVQPDCPYHYMICPNHIEQNKKHTNL